MKTIWRISLLALGLTAPTPTSAQSRGIGPYERVRVEGVELEYLVRGAGQPVVLVHAGVFADWFAPLLEQPALTGRYRVVHYHRAGYAGSDHPTGALSISQNVAQLRGLLRHLGIERAHFVGHSSGGNMILQLALEAPELVQTLALLEPALAVPSSPDQPLLSTRPQMTVIRQRFDAGDKAGALDGFMQMVAGPAYRPDLERALPGAFAQAIADADTFFGQELPALRVWSFTPELARGITQPVLAVMGEKSPEVSPIWPERQRLLLTWLPNARAFVLPGTTHLLHLQDPRGMTEALVAFFGRYPINDR
jgi:pimeloyl-ACP methyl ester carboxylesterase